MRLLEIARPRPDLARTVAFRLIQARVDINLVERRSGTARSKSETRLGYHYHHDTIPPALRSPAQGTKTDADETRNNLRHQILVPKVPYLCLDISWYFDGRNKEGGW